MPSSGTQCPKCEEDIALVRLSSLGHIPSVPLRWFSIYFSLDLRMFTWLTISSNLQDNMKRFKKETYQISRQEDIVQFFSEFEDYLTEDEMWNLSEAIKPRAQGNKNAGK